MSSRSSLSEEEEVQPKDPGAEGNPEMQEEEEDDGSSSEEGRPGQPNISDNEDEGLVGREAQEEGDRGQAGEEGVGEEGQKEEEEEGEEGDDTSDIQEDKEPLEVMIRAVKPVFGLGETLRAESKPDTPLKSHTQAVEPPRLQRAGESEALETGTGVPGEVRSAQGPSSSSLDQEKKASASASASSSSSSSSSSMPYSTSSSAVPSLENTEAVAAPEPRGRFLEPWAPPRKSLVLSSHKDSLLKKDSFVPTYPLTMDWTYGWNSSLPVYYLRDEAEKVLLYASGHTAIIYNVAKNSQYHLQGHPNIISCFCVSEDRRWVATADKGPDCLIIIWDSFSGIPVHSIFDSCPQGNGIRAIALSHDAKFLATISDDEAQKVCIWRWTLAMETPACFLILPADCGVQKNDQLLHSAPLLTEKTFNKLVGKLSQSVFDLDATHVLSATLEGKLVVWDIYRPTPLAARTGAVPAIRPCKLVHLQKEGITVLTSVDSYIVTGDIKGSIKFYDHSLSLVNWYSGFKLSTVRSLSFSRTPAAPPSRADYPIDCTLAGDPFVVRNLLIATSDATICHLNADGTKLEKLLLEPRDAICAVSCHPYQPLVTMGSFCGMIKVWNYEKKKYLFSRVFEKGLGVQSLSYNPEGSLLGVGFTDGMVHILDSMSLEDQIPEPFRYSRVGVTHITFSYDSQYMATSDVSFTVAVYKMVVRSGQRVWEYLARLRAHRKAICTVLFGIHLDSNEPRLLSLGTDRMLIEYDLLKSYKDHLEVLDMHRIDQGSWPTCMAWYPPLSKELFLLVCTSGYKVKLLNSTTKMCRKTLLGPVFGSPIQQIQIIPVKTFVQLQRRYLVFINKDKVGIQILPVDGNPHKTCAMVCHPGGVSSMALSYEGHFVFTAGGQDRSLVQWKINLGVLDASVSLGGKDLTPFYSMVFGGREGKFYRDLEDYFYYSQLRTQGIDTMARRQVAQHISLSELPFVMRAVGFYPSEEKIENMLNEVRFGEYVETGQLVDKINLPDFLRLYVNHRPPFGNTFRDIQESFNTLGYTNAQGQKAISRDDFLKLLMTRGEHMTQEDLTDCLTTLYGLNPEGWKSEPATTSIKGSAIWL